MATAPDDSDRIPLRTVPDLRGTPAEDASGLTIGRLWGALSEADTGLLRYLDLQLDGRPRHVLIPIGHARMYGNGGRPSVRLRAALLEDLDAVPTFTPTEPDAAVDERYEHELLQAWGRAFHGERYYAHPSFNHSGLFAGDHPIVRGAPALEPTGLQPLSALPKYQVAEGETDVRGRELAGADGTLGCIEDLIVDVVAEKVRYVLVALAESGREVLIPVGYLSIGGGSSEGSGSDVVSAPALRRDDVAELPGYTGVPIERTDEEAIRAALNERLRSPRRYRTPDFDPSGVAPPLEQFGV